MSKEELLQDLLYSNGVFHSCRGYRCFVLAVNLAAKEPWRTENICRDLYLPVALEFNLDVRAVGKALQRVCHVIMANGGTPFLKKLGGGVYWNAVDPYPRDIICIFAGYLRRLDPE